MYIDQCSLNQHSVLKRTWIKKNQEFQIPRVSFCGPNVTIYGAIGEALERPLFMICGGTNGDNWKAFSKELSSRVKRTNTIVIIDGHSSHRNKQAQEIYQ